MIKTTSNKTFFFYFEYQDNLGFRTRKNQVTNAHQIFEQSSAKFIIVIRVASSASSLVTRTQFCEIIHLQF